MLLWELLALRAPEQLDKITKPAPNPLSDLIMPTGGRATASLKTTKGAKILRMLRMAKLLRVTKSIKIVKRYEE